MYLLTFMQIKVYKYLFFFLQILHYPFKKKELWEVPLLSTGKVQTDKILQKVTHNSKVCRLYSPAKNFCRPQDGDVILLSVPKTLHAINGSGFFCNFQIWIKLHFVLFCEFQEWTVLLFVIIVPFSSSHSLHGTRIPQYWHSTESSSKRFFISVHFV